MTKPRIGIIVGSVREGRFADAALTWFEPIARARTDLEFEVLDLKDYKLPMFDEAAPPGMGQPAANAEGQRWRNKLAEMDGYVFVTAEYNRAPTGVLKNAIDWAYYEWNRKAAGFVGYGSAGGTRAIEQLRNIAAELQMATVRRAVQIDIMPMWMEGKKIEDFPRHEKDAGKMLDQLAWWTLALKSARDAEHKAAA
ncbi:MAG: NAD(P)H-dependent oxidoreductase [Alphaproteobacteria bacterium]|nr:NAD(P)H-dependent oxidoreductase [Alphaproteobacteria bacterium]